MNEIILIGAGGHCNSCIDVIEQEGKFRILGIITKEEEKKSLVMGYPVLGDDTNIESISQKGVYALVCVGQIKSSLVRDTIFNKLLKLNIKIPLIISPHSYVSKHSKVDIGSIIMHGVIVNSNVKIGRNTIINSLSLIEHDVNIGSNVHIATGSRINGGVKIGSGTFVGSGSIVFQKIEIGKNCLIPAGSIVNKNIVSNTRLSV